MNTANSSPQPDCIALPQQLDFAHCSELRQAIEASRGQPLALDALHVEFLGGAGAELLLATRAEWAARGLAFEVKQPSDDFLKGMERLGLPHSSLLERGNA
ncbi:STAS domain-containing protein [Shimia sp. R9_1]|uniref:STAS domain-containing protein n=1 Tax=unclassified Shimia TaxID=2630038 RepID=UPI001ADB1D70|nr:MULTISPECIES: STAS domain-containing protein [unclassified Shimia]MBO9398242.1 STAS domain-containing protein [Shimia sp. R9_2]MBO9401300.1 STAS domain-containing protein [Shimia sp. R9_3]MBO9406723.1 STAS domain-containing protein [Shimia sp. R9_1]